MAAPCDHQPSRTKSSVIGSRDHRNGCELQGAALASLGPAAAVGYDFFFCCLLRGRDPQPSAIFFIDEFDAHGLSHLVSGRRYTVLWMHPHRGRDSSADGGWRFSRCVIASIIISWLEAVSTRGL